MPETTEGYMADRHVWFSSFGTSVLVTQYAVAYTKFKGEKTCIKVFQWNLPAELLR